MGCSEQRGFVGDVGSAMGEFVNQGFINHINGKGLKYSIVIDI